MNIDDYCNSAGRGAMSALAKKIGVSHSNVSAWRRGRKPVPQIHAVKIEKATLGQVSRADLFPDWRERWPELAEEAEKKTPASAGGAVSEQP